MLLFLHNRTPYISIRCEVSSSKRAAATANAALFNLSTCYSQCLSTFANVVLVTDFSFFSFCCRNGHDAMPKYANCCSFRRINAAPRRLFSIFYFSRLLFAAILNCHTSSLPGPRLEFSEIEVNGDVGLLVAGGQNGRSFCWSVSALLCAF